jgi:polyferredoxin
MSSLLQPEERVLSTLNADGSRRWLDPKPVEGPLRRWRKILAWVLIVFFMALPHIHVGGQQWFFINIARGEFTIFGLTFLRTDTVLLALSMIAVFVAIFLVTALVGRVWCGWACPQTVYLEFLYRPLARLFDGKGRKGLRGLISKLPSGPRQAVRWGLVALISFHLANTFLAYFVGSRTVFEWSLQPPWVHPAGFAFVLFITGLMLFNFGFFREQLCLIACPYGRFQSVLLDKHSLIVGYDEKRGEPRGKPMRRPRTRRGSPKPGQETGDLHLAVVNTPVAPNGNGSAAVIAEAAAPTDNRLGDCVDCNLCVAVCPTGIDIRDGLQMECIHCARCIDACDGVMEKLGRDPGLIRYSSQSALAGKPGRLLRPRVILYPMILAIVFGALLTLTATQADAEVKLIRAKGQPYYVLPTGEVSNQIRVSITNRTDAPRDYTVTAVTPGVRLGTESTITGVPPAEPASLSTLVIADPALLAGMRGVTRIQLQITDDQGFATTQTVKLLGPMNVAAATQAPADSQEGTTP